MRGKTICELQMELKKKGIKGYSKMNKAQLEALLASDGKTKLEKQKKPKVKKMPSAKEQKASWTITSTLRQSMANRSYKPFLGISAYEPFIA